MTCTIRIRAVEGHRLLSRVLQVLEGQKVRIIAFSAELTDNGVGIFGTFTSDEDKAYRIEALLHRLEDVRSVTVFDREPEAEQQCCALPIRATGGQLSVGTAR